VQVSKLDVPVLLIWGQHDHTVPADKCFPQWYEAFKHNPRAEFYVIKNVRHDFPAEEVELTNFLVLQFLQGKKPTEKELARVKRNRSANDIQTGFRDKSTTRFWQNSKYNKFLI
jgi:dienelactone hydrolase